MPIAERAPAPTPSNDLNPRAAMGGNCPPLEELIPAEFKAALLADEPDFLVVLDGYVDQAGRARATDDEELKRCGSLIKRLRAVGAHIEATHKAVKEPHLLAGRLVDAEKNTLLAKVNEARARVQSIGDAYQAKKDAEARAERERIAAEQRAAADAAARAEREAREAEQAAARAAAEAANAEEREAAAARAERARKDAEDAMAAAALAPAAPAKAEPLRSDEGATVSGKQEWLSEVEDYAKAFKFVKGDARVREAIDKAIQSLVKSTKGQMEMAGVRIWPVSKATFR